MSAHTKALVLLLLCLCAVTETVGDGLFKHWANTRSTRWFIVGFVAYALSCVPFALSLLWEDLHRAILLFTVFSLVAVCTVGVWWFDEKFTARSAVGLALALAAIVVMEW